MAGIVCAVRGGPDSRPTINRSITLAKETGIPLYFLYVVNLDFLAHTTSSRIQAVSQEMHQMGEFILMAAQAAAAAQGIQAKTVVRHGNVRGEISSLCREIVADYLVLGMPQARGEDDAFDQEMLSQFSQTIAEETGAQVILAGGDEE